MFLSEYIQYLQKIEKEHDKLIVKAEYDGSMRDVSEEDIRIYDDTIVIFES